MPKNARYIIRWSSEQATYSLSDTEKREDCSLPVEGEEWAKWVEEHRAFSFHGRNGHLNMLKEWRRGEGYWYAYQRHGREIAKRYVGRDEQVRMGRLEEIASLLGNKNVVEQTAVAIPSDKLTANSVQFEPLLLSKLQLPRLQKSLLLREHLLKLLDKGLDHTLTVIAGPAGYGKTTLVNQWITQRSTQPSFVRVASVTLDEEDNDPLRFWRYVIAACQRFQGGLGKEALNLLLAHRLPPFKPLQVMMTALLNELSQLEHTNVLILDDFHVLNSPQVIESLHFFLEHVPTTFHTILLIRGDPPFSLARLRARNELLDIYPPQLAFSWEETQAFFEQELSFPLSPKLLRHIYERIDGWPTALRLLVRDIQQSNSAEAIERTLTTFAGSHWSIQDYFLSEVLYTLSTDQQEFLLQTSGLPLITAALCDAIMERTDSRQRINALHGGDLFLIPLDGGVWSQSRYQVLFAEAMQQEAHRRLGDKRLRLLAARASRWYEEHGHLDKAIETSLNATDFLRSAKLIMRLIESKQQDTTPTIPEWYSLKRWLDRLPEEHLEHYPTLCVYYAMCMLFALMEGQHLPGGKERIEHLLEVAEEQWRDANNIMKLAEVFAFRALLGSQEGRILQAVTWAKQSLAWLPPTEHVWRNLSLTVVGVGEMLDGKLTHADELLREALTLSKLQGNHIYARATSGMLSGVSLERGELRHAAAQLSQIQTEARAQEDSDDIAHTQLALAWIAYQWNNLHDAEQAAQEALAIGKQRHDKEFQARATARLARIEHTRGQNTQAIQRLRAWLAQVQSPALSTSPLDYQLLHEVQNTLAQIELANGNLAAVVQWFANSGQYEETLPMLQRRRQQVLQARLLLAQSETATAIAQLEDIQTAALQTGHVLLRREAQVVLALAYARQGLHSKAHDHLREVLAMTYSEGYVRLFLDEGKAMADLLRGLLPLLHERVLLAYTRQLLNAFAIETGTPAIETMPEATLLLEPLSQQEQRVLRLLAAGNANAEIAHELVVSVNTVRTQLQSIYRKLNVHNRIEASTVAKRLELV